MGRVSSLVYRVLALVSGAIVGLPSSTPHNELIARPTPHVIGDKVSAFTEPCEHPRNVHRVGVEKFLETCVRDAPLDVRGGDRLKLLGGRPIPA